MDDFMDAQTQTDEWWHYLNTRRADVAIGLLTTPYQPLEPVYGCASVYTREEQARYEAEVEFFDDHSGGAEDLLDGIVRQRYRGTGSSPIDMRGKSARQLVAAERLFQEKLVTLCGSYDQINLNTYVGLPVARSYSDYAYGLCEDYYVGFMGSSSSRVARVSLDHRTEPQWAPHLTLHPERLGGSWVYDVGPYGDIVRQLEEINDRLEDGQRRLGEIFLQFAQGHMLNTPELTLEQIEKLARICFLILGVEQSGWQSACYFSGRWKIGMAVSFARLMRLFADGAVTLHELFERYVVYSAQFMLKNHAEIRANCELIDKLYIYEYAGKLTKQRALRNLLFLYGHGEEN